MRTIRFYDKTCRIPEKIKSDSGKVYNVEDYLAAGGNSLVYECVKDITGEIYAIKFFSPFLNKKRQLRCEREEGIMQRLRKAEHSHLIQFEASGFIDAEEQMHNKKYRKIKIQFMIMEKAESNLREFLIKQKQNIPSAIYLAQFRGLTSALSLLHEFALHRDIKPENILIVGERWVLSDFGLATFTDSDNQAEALSYDGEIIGPRFWMSPEAYNRTIGLKESITVASDLFQLAAVFWWVVTRRHPSGILRKADWYGVDRLFEPLEKALEHSATRRYSAISDFQRDIISCIENQ